MKRVAGVLMLCGLLVAALVEAVEEPWPATLLILPFDNATQESGYSALEQGIPDLLSALLSPHAERLRLVEREQLAAIVQEQSLSWQQFVHKHPIKHIGKFSQAEYVVRGSFTRSGGQLHVQLLVYETETTRLVTSAETSGNTDELIPVCQQLASRIVESFSTTTVAGSALPVDKDPEKSTLMIKGLGHFYSAQFHKAIPAFMKILADDPNDALARYWLARTYYEAGLSDLATVELQTFLRSFPDHAKVTEVKHLLERVAVGEEQIDEE
ncbi:MAG: tetratricopeptide repeat protein [Candidatus Methylomirabilales bacterium]